MTMDETKVILSEFSLKLALEKLGPNASSVEIYDEARLRYNQLYSLHSGAVDDVSECKTRVLALGLGKYDISCAEERRDLKRRLDAGYGYPEP